MAVNKLRRAVKDAVEVKDPKRGLKTQGDAGSAYKPGKPPKKHQPTRGGNGAMDGLKGL